MWLYQFVPYLIFYSPLESKQTTKGQLQHLLACMRTLQVRVCVYR